MPPVFAKGNRQAIEKLLEVRREARREKFPRLVLRVQGILMSLDGHTTGDIAHQLKVHRSTVPLWIEHWNTCGEEGLWEGQRSGRPAGLSERQRQKLCDVLDSGPVAYGLETGIWTSPLVGQIIQDEFDQPYHPGHVRKLLRQLGYSRQRPTTRLVQAEASQKRKWVRHTCPNLKKTPGAKGR
jgi:transposase